MKELLLKVQGGIFAGYYSINTDTASLSLRCLLHEQQLIFFPIQQAQDYVYEPSYKCLSKSIKYSFLEVSPINLPVNLNCK